MRIRTIKPDFWEDEQVGTLTPLARLLFIGSWNLADDEGRLRWTPDYLNASLFMYDNYPAKKIRGLMDEVEALGMAVPYTGRAAQELAHLPNFLKHQKINRPQKSKFPPHPDEMNDSRNHSVNGSVNGAVNGAVNGSRQTHDPFTAGREGKGREVESPLVPLPNKPPAEAVNGGKPKTDVTSRQSENQAPPPDLDPPVPSAAVPLIERWLTVVANGQRPFQQADARRTITGLLDHLDPNVIDEIIGRCAVEAEAGNPPSRAKYLATACQRWAGQNGITVPADVIR